ncbi:hypothetical protein E4P42_06800 [Mycobacterium sp. PS03-16]|uniref:hypothetical protein n=1 Tax=Mycobacterium sp. PS03-16 TaxID=2559611 RepID=UPI00107336CA|nr:hypothetical protein [Mycobacterium sp. PS03-16]TFV60105.1 hypothetical protein E4P42_06800 [Mycobacterium sp. PS03-16]
MTWVTRAAVGLIAVQLLVRTWLAFGGYFYWDDLILIGRAGTQSLLSPSYLFDDHDGHVMPAAFLLSGVLVRLAPFSWVLPALSLVVLQLLASLALWRALHILLGRRPVVLLPLTFALFTPLAVPGFAWWAAGLNSLPMLAALAWVCADAVLLVRTGRALYAWRATAVYLGGLLFFEKAAVIPFVAFVVVALLAYVTGDGRAVVTVWRRGLRLWVAALALTAAWVGVYLLVVDQKRWSFDLAMTWDLLARSITHGIVPGLVGGPWEWNRWAPASPWATPPATVMVLGWVALAAVVAVSFARKERIGPVWAAAVGYAVACQVPIYLMRSSRFTALELAQTLRYLPDLVVVLALLMAVGFCAPNRAGSARLDASRAWSLAVGGLVAAFVASSLYSTVTFHRIWRDSPVPSYVATARAGLAGVSEPMLDQEVDPLILQRVQYPENLASHMFALLDDRPEFGSSATELRMLDGSGRVVEALVTWVRAIRPGPEPNCGYLVQPDFPVQMPLDGPLLPADWTAEINYLANSEGSLMMALSEGPQVKVPVRPGLNRVFVRLPGAGDAIKVSAATAALSVCISPGPVGFVAPR